MSKVPLKVFVSNFMGVSSVPMVVLLSIYVTNSKALKKPVNVIFVPKAKTQSFLPSPNPQSLNLPTPINAERLVFLLSGYDPSIVEFLFVGFSEGFAIQYDGLRESSDAKHLILALENPDVVDIKIKKELDADCLTCPFIAYPFHPFCISPQGVVPKKTPGDFRLIHNLSNPKGFSVNDSISSDHSSVCYATTQDAIHHI